MKKLMDLSADFDIDEQKVKCLIYWLGNYDYDLSDLQFAQGFMKGILYGLFQDFTYRIEYLIQEGKIVGVMVSKWSDKPADGIVYYV